MFYVSNIGPNPMHPAMSLFGDRLMRVLVSMVTQRFDYRKIKQVMKEDTGHKLCNLRFENSNNNLGREEGYLLSPTSKRLLP